MYRDRIAKVQNKLKTARLDALLVSNFYNILYLTGFKTSVPDEREAFLFVTKKGSVIITDRRYKPDFENVLYVSHEKNLISYLLNISQKEKVKKIGIEGESLTVSEYKLFSKKLSKLSVSPTSGIVNRLREVKDGEELVRIRAACKFTDQCLSEISKAIKIGQTEKEIAFKIEFWIKKKGHEPSFQPIVAVDANSAIPHYDTREGNGVVKKNSLILIDMGIRYKDYCSDITRVFLKGRSTTAAVYKTYEKLLDAQEKTIRHIVKTTQTKQVDSYCRNLVKSGGLKHFVHSTGHGVGLEVHEGPRISHRSHERVLPGQVFTIEPGVYYEGKFGIRIEDMVLITKRGVEVLTKFPKKLTSI